MFLGDHVSPHLAGILASICGGLVMLLPETKGIALPETVDDVEKLGRYYVIQHSLNESILLSHRVLVIHKGNDIKSSFHTLKHSKD